MLRRPYRDKPGDDAPQGKTFDLGLLKVTLSEVGNLYFESAINVRIDSDRQSLVEPVPGQFGLEPSAADKLIVLLKAALRKQGMTVLEEGGRSLPTGSGDNPNTKKLSLREFTTYKPSSDGVKIRAEQGYYTGTFNGAAMMGIAGGVLAQLAPVFRKAITVDGVERRMSDIYDAVDLRAEDIFQALAEANAPAPKRANPSSAAQPSPEQAYRAALSKKIPEALLSGDARADVINQIVAKTDGNDRWWCHFQGSARGGKDDPTFTGVLSILDAKIKASQSVLEFVAAELCDAIYAEVDRRQGKTAAGDGVPAMG